MELTTALLENLFKKEQAGGTTMCVTISMTTPTLCANIGRYSTCGGDETKIKFDPPLPLDEALLHAAKYSDKGSFVHQ